MRGVLVEAGSPTYLNLNVWVARAEEVHGVTFLFAGEYGSRPMGMATSFSDDDIYAVHSKPDRLKLALTLEDSKGRSCDVLSWHIKAVSARPQSKWACFPTYHQRSEMALASKCRHSSGPENHVTELLLCRRVWDDRGYLKQVWPEVHCSHLDELHVLDLLYSKGRGLWEHFLQGSEIPVRRYLNAVHRVLGMRWILNHGSLPPIEFETLLRSCDDMFVRQTSLALLRAYKASGLDKSSALVAPDLHVHDYLARQLDALAIAIGSQGESQRNKPLEVD